MGAYSGKLRIVIEIRKVIQKCGIYFAKWRTRIVTFSAVYIIVYVGYWSILLGQEIVDKVAQETSFCAKLCISTRIMHKGIGMVDCRIAVLVIIRYILGFRIDIECSEITVIGSACVDVEVSLFVGHADYRGEGTEVIIARGSQNGRIAFCIFIEVLIAVSLVLSVQKI